MTQAHLTARRCGASRAEAVHCEDICRAHGSYSTSHCTEPFLSLLLWGWACAEVGEKGKRKCLDLPFWNKRPLFYFLLLPLGLTCLQRQSVPDDARGLGARRTAGTPRACLLPGQPLPAALPGGSCALAQSWGRVRPRGGAAAPRWVQESSALRRDLGCCWQMWRKPQRV